MQGIIFDTETTGLAKFKLPNTDPSQPCIVQLGVQKVEVRENQLVKLTHYCTLASNPWVKVEPEAAAVTGIDDSKLENAPYIGDVMFTFLNEILEVDFVIAHNMNFDFRLVQTSCCHINRDRHRISWENLTEVTKYCTMKSTTDILKIPGMYGKYKWPKLEECYQHFFQKTIPNAHDAMGDVDATFDVINAMGFDKLLKA